ncbi:MAG: hypothetical protein ACJ0UT_01055 [Candidatus Latescibacterota bacterium]
MGKILLAIDDISLPLRKNTCLYLSKPVVRQEPVLLPSPIESGAPDNLAANFYGTVLCDEGKFRMWYYACHRGMNPDWPTRKNGKSPKSKIGYSMPNKEPSFCKVRCVMRRATMA